ncbi:MAG TPA: MFS transporter [Mycolicibacillus parakoreensis]|nr:MFS transporter [Mycolicibacillus parakoreensis]
MEAMSSPAAPRRMDRRLVLVMALITGLVVANSYYAQPLVSTIAAEFGASTTSVGLIVTASQVGYAIGLALLVPLGDLMERRRLLTVMLLGTAVCLVGMACAPNWPVLAGAAILVGLGSVVGQVLVPFAATLAYEEERGRVIGSVMTGLLLGILLSRVAAGLIAGVAGWRAVFVVAAVLMLVCCALVRTLPVRPPDVQMGYARLLASVIAIVREEPVLRLRIVYGMATYACFGVFWTSIGFVLAGGVYGWSDTQIGLFTLFGVAGAVAAKFAGALADRGYARWQTGVFVAVTAASFLLLWIGQTQVVAMAVVVALLDLGIQGTHISNQSIFYPLRPEARSRLNTAYMTSYFAAGSLGSVASAIVYGAFGWGAVCLLGAALPVIGTAVWVVEMLRSGDPADAANAANAAEPADSVEQDLDLAAELIPGGEREDVAAPK